MISRALIGGWEIGVTMDDIPFAFNAAIDVRHAHGHRDASIGIDRYLAAFGNSSRCAEVTAFKRDDVLKD